MGAVLRVRRAMPLTFVGNQFGGFRASGWAWLLNLVVLAPLVLSGPLPVRAVRRLSPYLAFLGLCGPSSPTCWRGAPRIAPTRCWIFFFDSDATLTDVLTLSPK